MIFLVSIFNKNVQDKTSALNACKFIEYYKNDFIGKKNVRILLSRNIHSDAPLNSSSQNNEIINLNYRNSSGKIVVEIGNKRNHHTIDESIDITIGIKKFECIIRSEIFDRVPLYYLCSKKSLVISNSIEQLLIISSESPSLNYSFANNYIYGSGIEGSMTMWESIHKICNNSIIIFDENFKIKSERKNIDFTNYISCNSSRTFKQRSVDFYDTLTSCIERRDLQKSVFSVSGGIDSMLLVLNAINIVGSEKLNCIYANMPGSVGEDEIFIKEFCRKYKKNISLKILERSNLNRILKLSANEKTYFIPYDPTLKAITPKLIGHDKSNFITGIGGDDIFASESIHYFYHDFLRSLNITQLIKSLTTYKLNLGKLSNDIVDYGIMPFFDRDEIKGFKRYLVNDLNHSWNICYSISTLNQAYINDNVFPSHPYFDVDVIKSVLSSHWKHISYDGVSKKLLRGAFNDKCPNKLLMRQSKNKFKKTWTYVMNNSEDICQALLKKPSLEESYLIRIKGLKKSREKFGDEYVGKVMSLEYSRKIANLKFRNFYKK